MNKVKNLQQIKSNEQNKYGEIIEYLKQDNGYWLENDKWHISDAAFKDNNLIDKYSRNAKSINLNYINNLNIKNEIKYFVVYSIKNRHIKIGPLLKIYQSAIKHLNEYIVKFFNDKQSFNDIEVNEIKWKLYLTDKGISVNENNKIREPTYRCIHNVISNFFKDFYDDREETEKDIWYSNNIKGVKIPASGANHGKFKSVSFVEIPKYYRDTVKKYFKAFITKKSWSHLNNVSGKLRYFFNFYYKNGYSDGFLEKLTRDDIEKYNYFVNTDLANKSSNYKYQFVDYIRSFLEYIQIAQYNTAPKKEISFLIFKDDTPKREKCEDYMRRIKFIPEPILKQLDNNIMDLDRPQYISIYILLRETGWRGTDILNLRYHNCLEQIWNSKEQSYNYYLCGEITKTGIALLKIPIRDKVAEMLKKAIYKAKELSTEGNNPKKYLFNTFEGKLKERPLNKQSLLSTIQRLIKEKDIRDINGELYHLKLHSLRHTRAKEYVEQNMGISIIQQILGHRSLQMTVHYLNVSENMLYEKWKDTEDLELFKIDTKTNELTEVDTLTEAGENLIKYEYIKRNLDAVRVPFGVCFKPSKIPCKQQINHCLTCASFCTTIENVPEYEEEILKVKTQIEISTKFGRELWAEKNTQYLIILEKTLGNVREQKLVHKNDKSREDS